MIIVEGPDGSGKSTLISELHYQRRSLKAMRGGLGGDRLDGWAALCETPVAAYQRKVMGALREERPDESRAVQPDPIAFDRFHLSEHVYSPILRGAQVISERDLWDLKRWLKSQGVLVVLCLPGVEISLLNVGTEGRERPAYQTGDFLRRSYSRFEALAEFADVVFDYNTQSIGDLIP